MYSPVFSKLWYTCGCPSYRLIAKKEQFDVYIKLKVASSGVFMLHPPIKVLHQKEGCCSFVFLQTFHKRKRLYSISHIYILHSVTPWYQAHATALFIIADKCGYWLKDDISKFILREMSITFCKYKLIYILKCFFMCYWKYNNKSKFSFS